MKIATAASVPAHGHEVLTLYSQGQADRDFLGLLYRCLAGKGRIELFDRDGVLIGTFQRVTESEEK